MSLPNKDTKKTLGMIARAFRNESNTLSLIPSENIMSDMAASMYTGKINSRYYLPKSIKGRFFMPGRENLGDILRLLEKKLCSIYKTEYAIAKALSGMHQMDVLMGAMRKISDKIIILDTSDGGHSKTKLVAAKHGFTIAAMNIELNHWDIDYVKLRPLIGKWRDKKVLIYIDHTIVVNPFDITTLMKVVPTQWIVYYDISHLQLFYFSGIYRFPAHENFFFGGSTHKSLPGPQKAVLFLNNSYLCDLIQNEFEAITSSAHTGSLMALLITVLEMEQFGAKYARDILSKTRYFARLLKKRLNVLGPSPYLTNTHQVCIDVPDAAEITEKLSCVGIITMLSRVPATRRNGLRLGIQEQCRLGITRREIHHLSAIVLACIFDTQSQTTLKQEVEGLAKKLRTMRYTLPVGKDRPTKLI